MANPEVAILTVPILAVAAGLVHPRRSGGGACPTDRKRMLMAGVLVLGLAGGAAGCANAATICAAAGGRYTGDTCTRPGQQAAQETCERVGGVFLEGEGRCAFGEGGP